MTKLKNILTVTTGIIIGASAISVLNAQSNAPYFEVVAIRAGPGNLHRAISGVSA
jgi:hypothetical protein